MATLIWMASTLAWMWAFHERGKTIEMLVKQRDRAIELLRKETEARHGPGKCAGPGACGDCS